MRAAAWSAFGTRETRHYAEYWLVAERESDSSTRRHILVNAKFHAEARDASANMCEETEETGRPLARRDYPTLSMGDDSQKRKQTNNRSNKRATYTTCIVSNVSSEERERTLPLVARSNSSLVVAGSAKMISMFTLARCMRDCGRKVHFHARSVTFKILTDSLFRTTTREIFAEFDCPAAFLDDQIWRFGEQQTRIVREARRPLPWTLRVRIFVLHRAPRKLVRWDRLWENESSGREEGEREERNTWRERHFRTRGVSTDRVSFVIVLVVDDDSRDRFVRSISYRLKWDFTEKYRRALNERRRKRRTTTTMTTTLHDTRTKKNTSSSR